MKALEILNIETSKLDNVGKIIDFLVIKLNNNKVIEVVGIKHIGITYISEVKYNVMSIVDFDTKVAHEVLLDDSNYDELMEDMLK